MTFLRTPDERFTDLPDFPFRPRYVHINGLRVHYLDEGTGDPLLCLHGVLEWSYSFRKMIPILSKHHRVIVPDLIGFGRSDKPVNRAAHTLQMHCGAISALIDALKLERITLVGTDWGAVVGLRIATEREELFDRLVIMNTTLPVGEGRLNITFMLWREFVELAPDLPISRAVSMGIGHGSRISKKELAGYEAPFPDRYYKAAAIALPLSLPVRADDPGAAEMRRTRDALAAWHKPALVMFSDDDLLFSKQYHYFRSLIPSAKHQPETIIRDAGHFLHEERGQEVARHVLDFVARSPVNNADSCSNADSRKQFG